MGVLNGEILLDFNLLGDLEVEDQIVPSLWEFILFVGFLASFEPKLKFLMVGPLPILKLSEREHSLMGVILIVEYIEENQNILVAEGTAWGHSSHGNRSRVEKRGFANWSELVYW